MNPTPTSKTETPEPETAEDPAAKAELTKTGTDTADAPADTITDAPKDTAGETPEATEAKNAPDAAAEADEEEYPEDEALDPVDGPSDTSYGLGAAAAAVVAVCLGVVALTGTWTGKVLAERQGLVGQLTTGQSATAEQQIAAIYGDAWHVTAAVNGGVALVALLLGVIVLALPPRAGWVRPVALAASVLGFLGVLISLGMYFDLFAALPTTGAATG
ncbi:hypothetical protein AB0O07_19740 [Streptomyces sp. NPDC093085]|uniref:hypothetical protein n=1 Tax=Streptomyces sp. NPDC093085 TaxID=3155068 RepID=UPI003415F0BA